MRACLKIPFPSWRQPSWLPVTRLPAAGLARNWRQDAAITGRLEACLHTFKQALKRSLLLLCLLLAAKGLRADPYSAALQHAKNVAAAAASTRQDEPPAPAAPAPAAPANPQPDPVLEATLQNIADLRASFDALSRLTDTNAIAAKKTSLTRHLAAAASGTKPSPASLSRLTDDLATAVAGNEKLNPQHQKLAQDVHAVFNGAHLSATQQQMIFDDVRKILQVGGAPPDQSTNLLNDIKAIATETQ